MDVTWYYLFNCSFVRCHALQYGRTPLMAASFEGHVDIVRVLIEAKAQINTLDEVCYILLQPENTLYDHHTCVIV